MPFERLALLLLFGLSLPFLATGKDALPTADLSLGGVRLVVEIANDAGTRRQGLMFREQLPPNRGMLFAWPDTARYSMWMKNTLIPLDVAFIDDDQNIVNIETMQPGSPRLHTAAQPVRWALEVNAGWFKRHDIVPGLRVHGLTETLGAPR